MKNPLFTKRILAERGLVLARQMAAVNDLPFVDLRINFDKPKLRTGCGLYTNDKIQVDVESCARVSPFPYSYPGNFTDRTPYGVIPHELGHHWHFNSGVKLSEWKGAVEGEPPVTSYGYTNYFEDIAEAFRLFTTNPTLLEFLWPLRYTFLLSHLAPVENRHWKDILHAQPRRIQAIEKRANGGRAPIFSASVQFTAPPELPAWNVHPID